MFFIFENPLRHTIREIKSEKLFLIRYNLTKVKFGTVEQRWDEFFKNNYNTSLKTVCWNLASDLNYSENYNHEIIVTFRTKKSEKLAQLITYGGYGIFGSDILRKVIGGRE